LYKFNLKHFAAKFDNKWTPLNEASVSAHDDINWFEKIEQKILKFNKLHPSRIIVTYFLACDNPAYLTAKWLLTTPHSHLFRILKSLFFVRILLSKHCWSTLSFNYLLNTNTISLKLRMQLTTQNTASQSWLKQSITCFQVLIN